MVVLLDSIEIRMLIEFTTYLSGLVAYKTEWAIFAETEHLAGSIDFVAINEDSELVLFDLKRTRELRSKYTSPFKT